VPNQVSSNAAHAAMEVARRAGVTAVFGNPGTTELPLMQALGDQGGVQYFLGLQECVATGMAFGYAAASGKLALVMLHAVPGIANGLAHYYNAYRNRLPVLLISGQQDRRHQYLDPILYGDLERMARPFAKWAWEARSAEEIPDVMRRAISEATCAPTGPTFLSLPLDLQLAHLDDADTTPPRPPALGAADGAATAQAAQMLLRAKRPALVAGDLVGRSRAAGALVELAEAGGMAAYWEPMSLSCNFPTTHPNFQGVLFPSGEDFRRVLREHDVVLWCGADLRTALLYDGSRWHDADCSVIVHSDSGFGIDAGFAPSLQLIGDPGASYAALVAALRAQLRTQLEPEMHAAVAQRNQELAQASAERRSRLRAAAVKRADQAPLAAVSVVCQVMDALPERCIVVDDAVSNSGWVSMCGDYADCESYFGPSKGGGIGMGMAAALGVKIAQPERPVLAFVGDGAAMYSIQSLWSAARYRLPVVFVILNNSSYRILKGGVLTMFGDQLEAEQIERVPGFDITHPEIDFVACASSMGVQGVRVDTLDALRQAVTAAFASGQPWVIDVAVERAARKVLK